MILDEDGVPVPRLRLWDVVRRGALYGVGAAAAPCVGSLFISGHSERQEFLAVSGGLCLIMGGGLLAIGLFFWMCCGGDIRRWRDWRTVKGQNDAPTVVAPGRVRLGTAAVVASPAAIGMYHLVDRASFDSWLY
ncbi:DUF6336 family protein [Streptomyces sp. NPDC047043]|uniref:DUF6336 family protein n=1 Tax=Streptomyces sp. NPDC047043 TaxID=3154497 RepID=UPI0033FA4E5E